MKTGPNRRTISSKLFAVEAQDSIKLGKFRNVDFSQLPDAEKAILDVFAWYQSYLLAHRVAPDVRVVRGKIDTLLRQVVEVADGIAGFYTLDGNQLSKREFRAAVGELLIENDLLPHALNEAFENAHHSMYQMEVWLKALRAAISGWEATGRVDPESPRIIRAEYYRRLHQALVLHGLDRGVGETSLIVQLVLNLDGHRIAPNSVSQQPEEADRDRRKRKDLAAEIKLAVKPKKGG